MLMNHKIDAYQQESKEKVPNHKKHVGFFGRLNQIRIVIKNVVFYGLLLFFLSSFFLVFLGNSLQPLFKKVLPTPSVLIVNPAQPIIEDSYFCDPADKEGYLFFFDLTESIRLAAKDKAIHSILFDLSSIDSLSFAQITELGTLIENLPQEKKTIAYASSYSQNSYALASYCDSVVMEEEGMLYFEGMNLKTLFFHDFAKKWGINIEVFRVGEMKSGAEPFLQNQFGELSKENLTQLTEELYQGLGNLIVDNRNRHREASQKPFRFADFDRYSSQFDSILKKKQQSLSSSPERVKLFSEVALEWGWIDKTLSLPVDYDDEQLVDHLLNSKDSSISFIDYLQKKSPSLALKKIAVLTLEGSIEDRFSNRVGSVNPTRFNHQIDLAFKDPQVKAVVLRINSPGGSASASETIRKKLVETAHSSNKPLVVSMGRTCASGGFWISSAGTELYANDFSITGSIGVFTIIPSLYPLLTNQLALHVDGVSRGGLGSFGGLEPMSEQTRQFMQLGVETISDQFLSIVSGKTGLAPEEIDQKAQGRVFSGQSAYEYQLVDGVGSFYDAVSAAARLAGIASYQIDFQKRPRSISERLTKQFVDSLKEQAQSPDSLKLLEQSLDPLLKEFLLMNLGSNESPLLYTPLSLSF